MILVDICVPSMNMTLDFRVDEEVSIRSLTEELIEMLQRKAGNSCTRKDFVLCSYRQKTILPEDKNLQACGIVNGDKLMIV